jgi:hypothetical protein
VCDGIVVDPGTRDFVDGSVGYAVRIEREHEAPGRTRVDVIEVRAVVELDQGRAWLTVASGGGCGRASDGATASRPRWPDSTARTAGCAAGAA